MSRKTVLTLMSLGWAFWGSTPWVFGDETAQLQSRFQAARKNVQTIVVHAHITTQTQARPTRNGNPAAGFIQVTEDQRDRALSAVADTRPDKIARIEEKYEERMALADDLERIVARNRDLSIHRVRSIDFVARRQRMDDTDLRPLDEMMAEDRIDESLRPTLSATKVTITDAEKSVALILEVGDLATVSSFQTFDENESWLSIGVVPPWVFGDGFEVSPLPGEGLVRRFQVTLGSGSYVVARFETRKDFGFSLVWWATYDRDGNEQQVLAFEDHQRIGGFWLPFRVTERHNRDGVADYLVRVMEVEAARINETLSDDLFEIPEGYRTQDLRPASHE